MTNKKLQFITFFCLLGICRICLAAPGDITNFEQCVAAGNRVLKSYPGRCYTEDGTLFVQEAPPVKFKPKVQEKEKGPSIIPKSYEECVSLGYPVLRSNPPKCTAAPELVFTKEGTDTDLAAELPDVESFAECKEAGFLIKVGNPDQCITPEGIVFFDEPKDSADEGICKDLCGDGVCQEMVCMGEGCPCPENAQRCKEDCQTE